MGQDTAKSPPRELEFTRRAASKKQRKLTVFQCFSIFWDFGSKMRPRCAKIGQDRTKMSTKRCKMSQDRLQHGTKIAQDGAKLGQDAAKMAQDSAKSRNFDGFGLSSRIQKPMKTTCFSMFFNF